MGRTLLLGTPQTSWREWLKANRKERDLICLDPADANAGVPARLTLFQAEKTIAWRFYGSLDAQRFPHVLVAGLPYLLAKAADDAIVESPAYRATPLNRAVAALIAQLVQPSEILLAQGSDLDRHGWPVGPHEVELQPDFPKTVKDAQRRAQWLKLLEACEEHELDLGGVSIEGARVGSGRRLHPDELLAGAIEGALHAELCGSSLFVVTNEVLADAQVSRALDHFHCTKVFFARPDDYSGLLCSFARDSGEDFGMGIVRSIDFEQRRARVLCTAVAPAPVRILRLGSLRLDEQGRELGEVPPWKV
jgi:hypothetical protein